MAKQKRRTGKPPKRYRVELTPLSLSLWGLGLLFVLSWVFVLGILVGRGLLPGGVGSLADLKRQISRLQEMVNRDRSEDLKPKGESNPEPKWAFHDKLTSRKEETARLSEPRVEAASVRGRVSKEGEVHTRESKDGERMEAGPKTPAPGSMQYTVQLASLGDRNKAEERAKHLAGKGHPAYFYKVTMKGKTYYRVRCWKFESREEAQRYALRLEREEGLKGFVTRAD
jgi:cell division protein FtsN